ncbi:MAG: glycogen/starch synthase [Bacteroidales bacterium]|nr:glycogen/starch synthase [Bacteroidales bacterium]
MEKYKILYVSQEITPYLPENEMSEVGRYLPQLMQEEGCKIRTFMPRYGVVNERRNQLHEVIRLSGMNLIIDDTDHPLIIKVASIQAARMQVYFIDNEEYFHRRSVLTNKKEKDFKDNDERAIFFARGVLETVKKLRWSPDIIHCIGWFSGLVPVYLKNNYFDDPLFMNSKVIYSVYNDTFSKPLNKDLPKKLMLEGIKKEDLSLLNSTDFVDLNKLAIHHSDGVINGSQEMMPEIQGYINELNIPNLEYQGNENYAQAYSDFYDRILNGASNDSDQ